jgi:hypothetical protein
MGNNIYINSRAGTGKTHLLFVLAKSLPHKTFGYIPNNDLVIALVQSIIQKKYTQISNIELTAPLKADILFIDNYENNKNNEDNIIQRQLIIMEDKLQSIDYCNKALLKIPFIHINNFNIIHRFTKNINSFINWAKGKSYDENRIKKESPIIYFHCNTNLAIRSLFRGAYNESICVLVPPKFNVASIRKIIPLSVKILPYNKAYGLEFNTVVIIGFDESLFKKYLTNHNPYVCPPHLYIALTRAIKLLYVIHDDKYNKLPFLPSDMKVSFIKIIGSTPLTKYNTIGITSNRFVFYTTQLCRFIPSLIHEQIKSLFTKIDTKYEPITIPDLSYYGIMTPLIYEFVLTNNPNDKLITHYNKRKINILSMRHCINILMKYVLASKSSIFEKWISRTFKFKDITITINGVIDCIVINNVWEFKCVRDIRVEHFLQLLIYAWILNDKSLTYNLLNIRTGELYSLTNYTTDQLNTIISFLIIHNICGINTFLL